MEVVQKCKIAWNKGKTDTERFAALFIIAKLIKDSNLTDAYYKEIFEIIGLKFLKKLFVSETDDCSSDVLTSLGCAILSQFCKVLDIVNKEEMCEFIPLLNDVLKTHVTDPKSKTLQSDALECIMAMLIQEKCRQEMLDVGMLDTLVNYYLACNKPEALQILKFLLLSSDIEINRNNESTLNKLLEKISVQFSTDHSNNKFELGQFILSLIIKCRDFHLYEVVAVRIRNTLTEILCNKLKKEHRDITIKLSSAMVEKFGFRWFTDGTQSTQKFFVVLVQIVCVEIRMILEDKTFQEVVKEGVLLTSCYSILETVISIMVSENWFQANQQYAKQLLSSLKSAFKAILSFLKMASTNWNFETSESSESCYQPEEVILATVRILCLWVAEESFILQDEVCKILPFVLNLCKKCFKQKQADDTKDVIDPLRFLVPPLCNLTADDNSRKVLLENEIVPLLIEYTKYQWSVFQKKESGEMEILLTTLCGVLLNIVVLESQVVAEDEEFFNFLKFLFSILPQLSSDLVYLTLKANFSVLGLLITKHCYRKVTSCETSFYRFLSASIKFLWDAHHIEEENDSNAFVITRQYREVWSDIMELWYLGMEALSTLLPLMPWIARFIVESGWPRIIMESLAKVNYKGIEGSIKSAYQAFLSTLVRYCETAAMTLMTCDAIIVCRKHEMRELERLLLNFTEK